MTTGRNFDEVLRVIDSLQLTAKHKVATPVNWQQGEDVIIAGSVSDDEAKEIFGELEGAEALHPHRSAARAGFCCGRHQDLADVARDSPSGLPLSWPMWSGRAAVIQRDDALLRPELVRRRL